jgi:CheY-like chemotaxis protein
MAELALIGLPRSPAAGNEKGNPPKEKENDSVIAKLKNPSEVRERGLFPDRNIPIRKGTGLRVLAIEDDADLAINLALSLELMGHEVEIALDGPSALKHGKVVTPDVVLLDLDSDETGRRRIGHQLKEYASVKEPFVIAFSSLDSPADRRRSALAGIDLHLTKPLNFFFLLNLLARFQSIISPA